MLHTILVARVFVKRLFACSFLFMLFVCLYLSGEGVAATANLRTKILDLGGFDSSMISIMLHTILVHRVG